MQYRGQARLRIVGVGGVDAVGARQRSAPGERIVVTPGVGDWEGGPTRRANFQEWPLDIQRRPVERFGAERRTRHRLIRKKVE